MLKNVSVKSRFSLTVSLGIAALVIVGICAMLSFVLLKQGWTSLDKTLQAKQGHLTDMRAQMGYGGGIHSFKSYLLSGQKGDLDDFRDKPDDMAVSMASYRVVSSLTPVEESSLRMLRELMDKYQRASYRAEQLWDEGIMRRRGLQTALNMVGAPRMDDLAPLFSELDQEVLTQSGEFSGRINQVMVFMAGLLLASLVLVTVFGLMMVRSTVGPLEQTVQTLKSSASGNLMERVEASSKDEVGRMTDGLNRAVYRMYSMMAPFKGDTISVSGDRPETLGWGHQQMNPGAETSASQAHSPSAAIAEEVSAGTAEAYGPLLSEISEVSVSDRGGAGFAAMADEVKALAKETVRATEDIGREIENIQSSTKGAIQSITHITGVINKVRQKYFQARH